MKIKIGFFAAILTATLFLTHSTCALACILSAILHEFGHIAAARFRRVRFNELRLSPFGASLIPNGSMGSILDEIFISISGPAINFLLFALLSIFPSTEFISILKISSVFLGILNLLPISSFDGGRILFSVTEYLFSLSSAERTISVTSIVTIFILWVFSLYFLLKAAAALSLFIYSCSLFVKIFIKTRD